MYKKRYMDQLKKEHFLRIIEKYQADNASKEEIDFLDTYYNSFGFRKSYIDSLDDDRRQFLKDDLRNSLYENIENNNKTKLRFINWNIFRWAISAAAIVIIGIWVFHSSQNKPLKNSIVKHVVESTIVPGGNKAILTLADGRKISLTDANNGSLAEQSGIRVTKVADGQLIYTALNLPSGSLGLRHQTSEYNTIETPKGGQYQVLLPDGSKVWLNAASSLKYPTSFSLLKERRVELNGEAYFEVAKDKFHPFLVKTINQEVEVLGTHFNINSYGDEGSIKTTLSEGSVKIKGSNGFNEILKPGQQATMTHDGLKVENVDSDLAFAWKRNQFVFESDDIQYIMRMIARWYNVEVEYEGVIPKNKFGGAVSRFENVSEVLKSLESTGRVKFRIEGRRIFVSK